MVDHQVDLARDWMRSTHPNPWDWHYVVPAIIQIPAPRADLETLLLELKDRLKDYPGKIRTRDEFTTLIDKRLTEANQE